MKILCTPLLLLFMVTSTIELSAQYWEPVATIIADDRMKSDGFGYSVSIQDKFAIVGAKYKDYISEDMQDTLKVAGATYIYEQYPDNNWYQKRKILATEVTEGDFFGWSVLMKDSTAFVGSFAQIDPVVLVYKPDMNNTWSLFQSIGSGSFYSYSFGTSIAKDAQNLIVGAYLDEHTGAVIAFRSDSAGLWQETQKIKAYDAYKDDYFGYSTSVSGSYAFIGAYLEDHDRYGFDSCFNTGSVYVYELDSLGNWNFNDKLRATDHHPNDNFGFSVCVSGNYAIVGAPYQSFNADGQDSLWRAGAAYIFELGEAGYWYLKQKLVAPVRKYQANFGYSVSISGEYAVAGSFRHTNEFDILTGSAFVYHREESGEWVYMDQLWPEGELLSLSFGTSVAIADSAIIIGSTAESEQGYFGGCGSAYIFRYSETDRPVVQESNYPGESADVLRIIPNPASDFLRIEFSGILINEISLIDLTGRIVLKKQSVTNNEHINISHLRKGLYLAKVYYGDKQHTILFVKE